MEKLPNWPKERKFSHEEHIKNCAPWFRARSQNVAYRRAALEFAELQSREPQQLKRYLPLKFDLWCYRGRVLAVPDNKASRDKALEALLIKRFVLRRERNYEKLRREVEALENLEKLQGVSREPIPDSVRLFVWQRDEGQCVKCGSRERLEFDHIIPVASGGANTERNVRLLCETCNRSKGAQI